MSVDAVDRRVPEQLDFFGAEPALPEGFRLQREVITAEGERVLLDRVRELPFQAFEFHGHLGNRRTVSFGWAYDFATERIRQAEPMPVFLRALRDTAAAFAGIDAERLQQVLVTEYAPGAGIGWHRDKGVFDLVVGLSLRSSCAFRLRRRAGTKWERVTIEAEPRSAYLLSGESRAEWEHSIPPVDQLRYSVTYRTLRLPESGRAPAGLR
jgi:alkylated DNA repair dioxygenase AlkB